MKYIPKKVYVLENEKYVELTYDEFCIRKEREPSYKDKFFLPIQGSLIESDREHYVDFYQDKERQRYLKKLDQKNRLLSIESFDSDNDNGVDFISSETEDIVETVAHKELLDKLRSTLSLLSEDEQSLIKEIFFDEQSERLLAEKHCVSQVAIHKRKVRILLKIKKMMKN